MANSNVRLLMANIAAHGSSPARTSKSDGVLNPDVVRPNARGAASERVARNRSIRSARSNVVLEQKENGSRITIVVLFRPSTKDNEEVRGCHCKRRREGLPRLIARRLDSPQLVVSPCKRHDEAESKDVVVPASLGSLEPSGTRASSA